MKLWLVILIIFLFLLIIDLYSYKGLRSVVKQKHAIKKYTYIFILFSLCVYVLIAWQFVFPPKERIPGSFNKIYFTAYVFLVVYIPKLILIAFHVVDDLVYLFQYITIKIKKLFSKLPQKNEEKHTITRYNFLTRIGLLFASIPLYPMIKGFTSGRFQFEIYREKIRFDTLPEAFNGYKIVQISDIHLGSLHGSEEQMSKAFDMILAEKPDMIVFTGDLVNNYTEETQGWDTIFRRLEAPDGVYSILGNHDYGDYYKWATKKEQIADHRALIYFQQSVGMKLLLNEHIRIARGQSNIVLSGVENWGLPPFRQSGDLQKTLLQTTDTDFIVLLSHDPSHWDKEVIGKKNIFLTLSGHTHGMQFGMKWKNHEWSPAEWKYPRWAGLYQEGNQYLYVNRGLGYIGMPARIGMNPEITVLELFKA